jgi:hypothetical protein
MSEEQVKTIMFDDKSFSIGNYVSYEMENAKPSPAIGQIKKFLVEKKSIVLKHLGKSEFTISFNQKNLHVVQDHNPVTTPHPVEYLKRKSDGAEFRVGDKVSYVMANSDPSPAIGTISKINPSFGSLTILHADKKDNMINIDGKDHDIKLSSLKPTSIPVRREYLEKDGVKYGKDDTIRYILKHTKADVLKTLGGTPSQEVMEEVILAASSVGKIKSIDAKTENLEVTHSDGSKIINISTQMKKIDEIPPTPAPPSAPKSQGNKKYTLKNENKYYLKYAEYKMKYLSLKK